MIKRTITAFLVLSSLIAIGQPQISNLSYPSSVDLFGMYEISFTLDTSYSDPYDPNAINIYALFISPNNDTTFVYGFYYEGYTFQKDLQFGYERADRDGNNDGWRIRFTPNTTGTWKLIIFAQDASGTIKLPKLARYYTFICSPVQNANGFISKANNRYLKREVVHNGQRKYRSFYPVGLNVAWYECANNSWKKPFGIYYYERIIDSLYQKGNFIRVFLNQYQAMSLYGPEYALDTTTIIMYFDSTINQKDAAEFDHIINYAADHDITLMPCFFSYGDFRYTDQQEAPTLWSNNPFNLVMGLNNPCCFFTDSEAIKVSKKLIRYMVSRWGYATNIMSWEIWNEVSNMFCMCQNNDNIEHEVLDWHETMVEYITELDPFHHCISTSMGNIINYQYLYLNLFDCLDFVQQHNYQNIQKAKSNEQMSYVLFNESKNAHFDYPTKPFLMGEFGFGLGGPTYAEKDPYNIDMHNSLWSSLFSTSMGPAIFWSWRHVLSSGTFDLFRPIYIFCNNLPILSDSYYAYTLGEEATYHSLVFPNAIETYYMKNSTEDTIYGWCQDTAFCYQSLRWLTDSVYPPGSSTGFPWHFIDNIVLDPQGYVYTMLQAKKPSPSINNNYFDIPLTNPTIGTSYKLQWYNSESGTIFPSYTQTIFVQSDPNGTKYLRLNFPSAIRDLNNHSIHNRLGDVVFKISKVSIRENGLSLPQQ